MSNSLTEFPFASLARLRAELSAEKFAPAEVCARYVLLHLHSRHPSQWLSSPRGARQFFGSAPHLGLIGIMDELKVSLNPKQRTKFAELSSIRDLYVAYFFRGVVLDSHEGLVGWMESRYPLVLRLDIPTPDEMLDIQCRGLRFVSLQLDDAAQFKSYGRHADACDFLLHDFEHAHKFFADPLNHRGQVKFFQQLKSSLAEFERWSGDAVFARDLNYLKADMNSHPVHLTKYLKAVVLSAEMRKTGQRYPDLDNFWNDLFSRWGFTGDSLNSVLNVNSPEVETENDLRRVAEVFNVH